MSLQGNPESIIANFIVELRGKGPFLSSEEYTIIRNWVLIEPSCDQILLTLSDVFELDESDSPPPAIKPLSYYDKKVSSILKQSRVAKS